ncbi:L-fuconolactonase [Catalinimonas alkaloidigena]|uniref:amidohydrolase family protein n=1 Tax=Catalinimonas alkaloidigena TaxID=1075417 RepID=UPI0024076046|nr:amidohydrolase family protein [Catalinimonas alkaloidigena]MDF9796349.1 L-fuconolactonase [Catalinimonas alkaloidigena]
MQPRRTFLKQGLGLTAGLMSNTLPSFSHSRIFSIKDIPITDTHVHFWELDRLEYPWLEERPSPISRDFVPDDYLKATSNYELQRIVFVESGRVPEEYLQESDWISQLAEKEGKIAGIVAFFPIEKGAEVQNNLEKLADNTLVKGIRRMGDPDELVASYAFQESLNLMNRHQLSLDIHYGADGLKAFLPIIDKFPDMTFVVNHLGLPDVKQGEKESWQKAMQAVAERPNVYCKLSGLLTRCEDNQKNSQTLKPYILSAIDYFGTDRMVFASDWPVLTLGGTFEHWLQILDEVLGDFKKRELRDIFYQNAARAYRL